ncbi:SGNH/GDSL hydrolase family protein [Luteolibacter algae]|uniref:SGNH/GDSL hydrolase family protein n=1 Tax=Luteolibacter algae TaxID=454151 RepID=A0ABW5D6W5_9BACT
MMKSIKSLVVWLALGCILTTLRAEESDPVKIVLVGDSTTIGNTPRQINPEGPHLEQMIEQLAAVEGLPELEVINSGKGGETARRIMESGWYRDEIAGIPDVDLIFVRLGINDWFRCENLESDFPAQMKVLIESLRKDHPKAKIILSTICRFMPDEECAQVNDLIKKIAVSEKLDLFDLYTPYHRFLLENGENTLNVRQCSLSAIPEKYHSWLKPYTHFRKGWGGRPDENVVRVNDLSLDPLFGQYKGWYSDRHPNSTGYNLIAHETVKYLSTVLEK